MEHLPPDRASGPAESQAQDELAPAAAEVVSPAPAADAAKVAAASAAAREPCPICMEMPETRGGAVEWPAGCGHYYCPNCTTACLNRSLRCPMCRTEAPDSAKPPPSRAEIMLTLFQRIRLEEIERLRAEYEANNTVHEPRTRVGRWIQNRWNAWGTFVDSMVGPD